MKRTRTSRPNYRLSFPSAWIFLCRTNSMAKQLFVFFLRGSFLRSSRLSGWTFVSLVVVVCGGLIHDLTPPATPKPATPKSPTTCGGRPTHCQVPTRLAEKLSVIGMPWSCQPSGNNFCLASYNDRFDGNSGEKKRLSGNLSSTIYYYLSPNGSCLQQLNLTWIVNLYDADLPVVGFRFRYTRLMPSKNIHQTESLVFFLQKGKTLPVDENGNTMFYYDCLRLSIASKYHLELFSLHRSTDAVPKRLESPIGAMNLSTDCDVYPEGHLGSNSTYRGFMDVSQLDIDCSITAYFTPASESFGFKAYDVQLSSNGQVIMTERNLSFTCKNFGPVIFKNVGAGSYILKVIPIGGRCPCSACRECAGFYKSHNVSKSNYSCQTTVAVTDLLTLPTSNQTPEVAPITDSTTTPEVAPITDSTMTPAPIIYSTTKLTEDAIKNQNVIIAVAAFFVALVIVAAVATYKFNSRKRGGRMTISSDSPCIEERDISEDGLTRQPVVVIYASDNPYHNDVVHYLAAYLQKHCCCDVRLDQWFQKEISEVSALDWILHQLKSVKNVVIINSEAGFRQYSDGVTEVAYEKLSHETPLEDMFLPAMRELRTEYFRKPKSRKLFKVAFPYTDPKFFLNDFHSGMTYQLMTHIEDLVLNIHDHSKHSRRGKTSVVGINHRDYTKSDEGQALEKAIQKANVYHKQNPSWFSNVYQIKPSKDQDHAKSSKALEKAIQEANVYHKQNPSWFSNFYQIKPSKDQDHAKSSMDKDLTTQQLTLLNGRSCNNSDPLSVCDSGLGTSIEHQNLPDYLLGNMLEDLHMEVFKAPDLDDASSVSSGSIDRIDLQAVMLNKDYDNDLEL